jgi:hypothetical protein
MSTKTETKPKPVLSDGTMNQWPPLAHIERKSAGPLREGKLALCGAKLMGIRLPDATKVCEKCIEIARKELSR